MENINARKESETNLEIKGIIYKYTSPSGKVYIGQTTRERDRRAEFLRLNQPYGGDKINNARKKYLPENFTYEVIESYRFQNEDEAINTLDDREIFWIAYYDSFRNGYNSTLGGGNGLGREVTEATRLKISEKLKGSTLSEQTKQKISESNKGKHSKSPTLEARKKMSESHKGLTVWNTGKKFNEAQMTSYLEGRKKVQKAILCLDKISGEVIAKYTSTKEAAETLGCTSQGINNVLKGRNKTCKGYKWIYDE